MKQRVIWWMIPALAIGLGACNKKEEPKAPAAPEAAAQPSAPVATPPPAEPVLKPIGLSTEERAAKLGFVKHLPQDTEVVIALHNGSKSAERIKSSRIWKLVQSQMGMGGMTDLDEDPAAEDQAEAAPEAADPQGPAALFGTEFTIALGKPTGEQTSHLLTLNRRMGYFQMRTLAKALVASAKSGDFSTLEQSFSNQYGTDTFKDVLADPESGVALFEKMSMPPLYLAFRTGEANRDSAAQQLASLTENLGMLGEIVQPVEVEKDGRKFAGQKISGAKISENMAKDRQELESMIEPDAVDQLLAAIAKKDLVVLSGTIGDYAVLFIGSSVDDLRFSADSGQSLVAGPALSFCDAFASKELAAVIYGQKTSLDQMNDAAGGLADMAHGLRDGLAGTDGLGDTRDLEALLRIVAEREAALRKLVSSDSLGLAAFFEEGLKIETFGGTDQGAVDWKSPNKLASLGNGPDVVLFANMTTDAAYDEKARAYAEALTETAYAAAMKVSELPMEDESMKRFKEMSQLFDTRFRQDMVSLWETLGGDVGGALGNESALVIDLKGTVPAIPGIPQPVVDEAKFPRISVIAPVTDRAKLASSWDKMNSSLTNILKNVSDVAGKEIPMQKPVSSEKDGYTTWFFPLPFFNDDFMPSVTVGDQWFAASTSKNHALDLVGQAAKATEIRHGLWLSVNFKTLQTFLTETNKVLEKNSAAIFGEAGRTPAQLKNATRAIKALDDLDKLTVHARRDEGVLRGSIHFKTR